MITGAVIGFLIYTVILFIGIISTGNDFAGIKWDLLFVSYLIFIGIGFSIGYLVTL